MASLTSLYPWTAAPLVASAPMRLISTAPLAAAVTLARGLGFIGAGNDVSTVAAMLAEAHTLLSNATPPLNAAATTLPIGIGVLCWGADLQAFVSAITSAAAVPPPAAVWLFAPHDTRADFAAWATAVRGATGGATHIWIQVGSVAEAVAAVHAADPDVLVVQGTDAGGHGLLQGAGLVSLVPEVVDAVGAEVAAGRVRRMPRLVGAGGIVDGRGVAAALALGAEGVTLGTRYLVAREAVVKDGYRAEVVRAQDGGQTTVRTKVYDTLRGTTEWPEHFGGRGVVNRSYEDWHAGMSVEENKKLYKHAETQLGDDGWGPEGRMTTYAGTAVGLVRQVMSAKEITEELRNGCKQVLDKLQQS